MWNQELRYYISLAITAQPYGETDLPISQPNCLDAGYPIPRLPHPPASPHCSNGEEVVQEYPTCCPSPTPFGLGLGPDNPERTSLPQETLGHSVEGILTPSFATHTGILTSKRSTSPSGLASQPLRTLSYHCSKNSPQLR